MAVLVVAGASFYAGQGTRTQGTTETPISTATRTTTSLVISVTISLTTTTTSVTQTVTQLLNVPFANPRFIERSPGPSGETCSTGFCLGSDPSYAIPFDCQASMPQSCQVKWYVNAVRANFSIVASWQVGQRNEPTWANCSWKSYVWSPLANIPPSLTGEGFGYCIPIGSTAFIIAIQAAVGPV
jgi:hypothetical protein